MSPRFRFLLLSLVAAVGLLTACSNDTETNDASSDAPASAAEQPEVGPAVQTDSGGVTTTTTTAQANEIEPSVLSETKRARVFVAANGNDSRSGENAGQAVASLNRALSILAPGGTVVFQPGTYAPLRIEGVNGAAGSPIRLEAAGNVEFRDKNYSSGAGILIRNSRHLEVVGMSTRHSLWGIYMENSHNVTLRGNNVGDVGQEGIRIKAGSTNVRIDGNTVADTGRRTDKGHANGEGIYIGTGTPSGVDHVSNIVVVNNRILRVTDEAIDVKRPATNIDIIGNTISDVVTQTSGAIVVHLNGDQGGDPDINIERNVISNVTRSSPYRDGNCIVSQVTIRIVNNVLHNCQHRGVYLRGSGGTATVLHNTLVNTGEFGTVVDEGRGMRVVSENNLGVNGGQNRTANSDAFVNAGGGNFRIRDNAAADLRTAPNRGVSNDISGASRPSSGPVTFGAYEVSAGVAAPAPTTTATPRTTTAPTTAAPRTTTAPTTTATPRSTPAANNNAAPRATTAPPTTAAQRTNNNAATDNAANNNAAPRATTAPTPNSATSGASTTNNNATSRASTASTPNTGSGSSSSSTSRPNFSQLPTETPATELEVTEDGIELDPASAVDYETCTDFLACTWAPFL